jgi:hypothetical protein
MSIFYVRKNGSGTHTTIQSAFIQAVNGDTIDVEAGLFEENVDFYKSGITLKGAGKNLTEIRGIQESNVTKTCTFNSGSTTLNIPAGTSGWLVGRYIQGTGLAAGTRIVSVSATSVTVSIATTAAKTNQSVIMVAVPATIVVRGASHTIKDLKITAVQALESRCLADNAAIFFRTSGNGELPATNYILEDCIVEARGESAIMTDASASIGNGIIRRNTIQGKTFVGSSAAQVPAFGTMTKTGTVLSNRTIQFSDLSGITAPHAGNSQGSEINPGLRVVSISGNVVTVSANITDAVGTNRSFSFANVQFNYPNVARQLVVVQGVNTATQFLNNTVNGVTGSGISYNTAVTVDTANAVITGNTLNGEFKYGYALRARGAGSTVSNNMNYSLPSNPNQGFLIGPTGSQVSGMSIGSNTSILASLIESSQTAGNSSVSFQMSKDQIKTISKVSSDAFYSNEANWHMVSFVYKNTSNNKRLTPSFKNFSANKVSKLRYGMMSGDVMQLHKIIISKSNRQHLVIKRSEIDGASAFDFSLTNNSTAAAWSGNSGSGGSGSGGSGSGITAYQYYKFAVKSTWIGSGNGNMFRAGPVGLSDIAFKDASGNIISMSGASVNNIYPSTNYGLANLINGSVEQNNIDDLVVYNLADGSIYNDLFTITMASAVSVSKLLIGAQGGTSAMYNMPREFKLLGSNDNVNFTEIYVSTPEATTDTWFNYKGTYREFSISGSGSGGSGSGLTSYRYVKFAGKQAWSDNIGNSISDYFGMADFGLKWGGTNQNLSSYTITNLYELAQNPQGFGALTDGTVSSGSNYVSWQPNNTMRDLFVVDLNSPQQITDVLIAPVYAGGNYGNHIPKEFKVYGSLDGVNYTEILSVNQTDSSSWIGKGGTYASFPVN